jgi:hypothetical protein
VSIQSTLDVVCTKVLLSPYRHLNSLAFNPSFWAPKPPPFIFFIISFYNSHWPQEERERLLSLQILLPCVEHKHLSMSATDLGLKRLVLGHKIQPDPQSVVC